MAASTLTYISSGKDEKVLQAFGMPAKKTISKFAHTPTPI